MAKREDGRYETSQTPTGAQGSSGMDIEMAQLSHLSSGAGGFRPKR